ncbi:TRAF-like family protein [Euphorbia peplus]|nr:TRAF-like family protein [Euphorbia peplus]
MNSFSQFSKILIDTKEGKHESNEFEAGDYKWKLVLYPSGNGKRNGEGHISLYLVSTDEKVISCSSHVNMLVSFFVYDHIRDKYLTIQDGKSKRYHVLKTEHGFDQLLPLDEFNDPINGYVFDDCCVLGAEVHIIKNTAKGNELSLIKDPPNGTFTWKISSFSTLEKECYLSDVFSVGGSKWKLGLFPKDITARDHVSLYLRIHADDATPCQSEIYVEINLLIKDQVHGIHSKIEVSHWIGKSRCCGIPRFMLLEDVHNASKGFLVNDTLVVEAQITLISISRDLIS